MNTKDTPKALPPVTYDPQDPVSTGLRIGRAILSAVYGPPFSELDVPDPLPCSRTLKVIKGGRS